MQRPTSAHCAVHDVLNALDHRAPPSSAAASVDREPARLTDAGEQGDRPHFQAACRFKRGPWTKTEDDRLRELVARRTTSREIAIMLQRTLSAVRARARVIDVQLAHASQIGACRPHRRASLRPSRSRPGIPMPRRRYFPAESDRS